MTNSPQPLGLRKSFGFGDRLGLATPGHIDAVRNSSFLPIFAQQSVREMERTQRSPQEIVEAAQNAVIRCNWDKPWGADADHHKTVADIQRSAAAGFTFFTLDPSAFVNNSADRMSPVELEAATKQLVADGVLPADWQSHYLGHKFEVADGLTLQFSLTALAQAAVKYARAIHHSEELSRAIAAARNGQESDIEVSVDETESVTSPLDHLFVGLELKRRGVKATSVAPRFIGDFEKGIDYRGDHAAFEKQLAEHLAVAKFCGPYKISIHSGSDKFSIYPTIGRICGDLLHVKTAGTNYLEALRVVARTAPAVFGDIIAYTQGRFETDRQSYHISTTGADVAALPAFDASKADWFIDDRIPRQLLHVTFGSVLTIGTDKSGRKFKDSILEQLHKHSDLHHEFLVKHLGKHLELLSQG